MKMFSLYRNFIIRNLSVLVFFAIVIFFCTYLDFSSYSKNPQPRALNLIARITLAILPMHAITAVSNIFLVRGLFLSKRYGIFIIAFIGYWLCAHQLLQYYFALMGFGIIDPLKTVTLVSLGTAIYFLHLYLLKNIIQGRIDIISAESELSFLKQQLNPHFLLNAMNNLYGESLSDLEKVPARILNLSDLLRYQIEATKKNTVALEEEIEFIRRYIDYCTFSNERLKVEQEYLGNWHLVFIPPLFYLPLVENAVKFSSETTDPAINLQLTVNKGKVVFSIQNNYLLTGSRLHGTGMGIENVKRRLGVYGLRHKLSCRQENNVYSVNLTIWGLSTAA
ncbi:sensor histidine kinase [Flavobacterium rhizosphaerae]|uniref:Sensor histidine kinase n=1 Tax=Flavobacterium rhizosphaerae TaxID=3163298 RepID=A0ABW8Z270_9FLAO